MRLEEMHFCIFGEVMLPCKDWFNYSIVHYFSCYWIPCRFHINVSICSVLLVRAIRMQLAVLTKCLPVRTHGSVLAALKQLFSLLHRRILGDLLDMFKITYGLLWRPPSSIQPAKGYAATHSIFHQQWCCTRRRQFAFTIRAVQFWNKLPAEIIDQ